MLWCIISISIIFSIWFLINTYNNYKYPLKYNEEIYVSSSKYDLEPQLVASVINAESSFVATAVSNKGAKGLMQLLPSTAQWIAKQLNYDGYTEDKLFIPHINIEFGCYYLNYLSKKFSDETVFLCAYNAGETVVRSWLKNVEYSKDGNTIDTIPFSQTKSYVKKIEEGKKYYTKKLISL